jgi:hypothetical protein
MGGRITKTIVVNLGSKERENEDTPVSFGNTFEVDEWKDVDEYALSVFNNSENELHEPAAIPTKNPSVTAEDDTKSSATPQEKMYKDEQKLAAIPTNNSSVTTDNDKKPAANLLEEMFRTIQEPPIIHPSLPPFGSNVVAWICEFCDSQWPPSQKRCGTCKRWKGGKRSMSTSGKKDSKEKLCQRRRKRKGVGKVNCLLLFQARMLIFLS